MKKSQLRFTVGGALPRYMLACALACAASALTAQTASAAASASASAGTGQCILAGRLSGDEWAPRMAGVELLDAKGQRVSGPPRQALERVRQVRLNQTALLSTCDGNQALTQGDSLPAQPKAEVPALSAAKELLAVEAVAFPKLRGGSELVEIKLASVPAQRVVMLKR